MYKVECRKLIASPFFLLSVIALYFVILLGIRDFYPENEISSMLETGMGRIGLTSLPFLTTMPTAWFASEETICTHYYQLIRSNLKSFINGKLISSLLSSMKASTIQTFGISREFNGITVLNDINLALESGKIYGLIGRNGSGKTVLMKIICGFLMPSKGYVLINGRKLGKDIDFPENTGIIIEAPTFLAHLNAYQNLKNLADIRGIIGPDEIRQSISAVGLDPNSNKKVGKFSLGMRQKLGIAQAIMENPDILILDEPFNGLDKDSVKEMRSLLLSLRDAGKLILLASHNPLDISLLCDSAFEIDRGMLFPFEITKSQNVVE